MSTLSESLEQRGQEPIINVASFEASKVILDSAHAWGDQSMIINVTGIDEKTQKKEKTLNDGKQTTHATTLVAYQRQQYGPKPPPKNHAGHSTRRRSLEQAVQIVRLFMNAVFAVSVRP